MILLWSKSENKHGKEQDNPLQFRSFFSYFKGNTNIINELDNVIGFDNLGISVITVGEIYYGMKKSEKLTTKTLINQFNKYLINKEICIKFMEMMLGYLDNRIGIPDAFIAATAICNNLELYTLSIQDFNYIEGVKLYKPHYLQ